MSAMADKDPVLFLDAVERRYHQGESILEILGGAELAVWPGQSVALIGPSGAGPTASARKSAAPRSASSISSIISCRNSPRWRTSCCRR